jgi:hypothetical protein
MKALSVPFNRNVPFETKALLNYIHGFSSASKKTQHSTITEIKWSMFQEIIFFGSVIHSKSINATGKSY